MATTSNSEKTSISNYRYERKFFITNLSLSEVEVLVKVHPYQFFEIYHQRFINNIYYDSPTLECLEDNISGVNNRMKVRIRWYGDLFGNIEKSKLELKIRTGFLGKKHSTMVEPFQLCIGDSVNSLSPDIKYYGKNMSIDLSSFRPTLLNRYSRKYYLSQDKSFRITIDSNQIFSVLRNNVFSNNLKDSHSVIVELKYDEVMDDLAREISTLFPFRLSKSSKYVRGLTMFD